MNAKRHGQNDGQARRGVRGGTSNPAASGTGAEFGSSSTAAAAALPGSPLPAGGGNGRETSNSKTSYIVQFSEADHRNIDLLGAKGAKLVEDYREISETFPHLKDKIGVPDGFILTTEAWRNFHKSGDHLPDELFRFVLSEIESLEARTNRKFGDTSGRMPLFVAVRGGAPISLPGALGTALNVGFNDEVAAAMIEGGEDEAFVLTTYLTAIRMYGEIVFEIPYDKFYRVIREAGDEGTISPPRLRTLIGDFKRILEEAEHPRFRSGFECNLHKQLRNNIEAVFGSWMAPIAVEARRSRGAASGDIPDSMGTAAIVQRMVFGNRDEISLSGVLFTREQRTGAASPIIEWAPKVQCDKIVSGKLRKKLRLSADLKELNPDIYEMLLLVRDALEMRSRRPLDIEFTVENGRLFLLQRRPMRMTSRATVRAMWDLIDEGKTTIQLASMVINQALAQPEKVLREDFSEYTVLATGKPITDTADSGILVFGSEAALGLASRGEQVILLRKRPYGESDLAVNHPGVRGIVRVDGQTTNHEAVSAVAYGKPYLINTRDSEGKPLLLTMEDETVLNPDSIVTSYIGKKVFLDGESGILGFTDCCDFLEDKRGRNKLYLDWEHLKEQFDSLGYNDFEYGELIDLHYQWELELENYLKIEQELTAARQVADKVLLGGFDAFLNCFRPGDRIKAMTMKEVFAEDFDLGPPITYHGNNLSGEFMKIMSALMLYTTWWTHWIHEILVEKARARGETENDVIRDINLKNRTMSLLGEFENEGFHLMKTHGLCYLVLASNFEYEQDPDHPMVGPAALDYDEKALLAQRFLDYLMSVNEPLGKLVRVISGEPPLGQGHARIVSIGIAAPENRFDLVCRYLRTFLDQSRHGCPLDALDLVSETGFTELYQVDPFFASHPELRVTREVHGAERGQELFLAFGGCSFGEYDGRIYGKEEYDGLTARVDRFLKYLKRNSSPLNLRPWHFEVDPFRRHSLIAAVGVRFSRNQFCDILQDLKGFLQSEC